jgi:hypothetical protein
MPKLTKYQTEFIRDYNWGCADKFRQSLQGIIGYLRVYEELPDMRVSQHRALCLNSESESVTIQCIPVEPIRQWLL